MHPSIAIAQDLIAIPSVNPMGAPESDEINSERQVTLYVETFLRKRGIDCRITGADYRHPNVLAYVDANASETILLEAHMDTVSHENMEIDPFDPVVREGRLYGRGSCDTKSSLATYLHALSYVLANGRKLKRNVIVAGVHGEEYSFAGSHELVKEGIKATFAIVGEPTALSIVYTHKGVCRFRIHTEGVSAHAALPWLGQNAIYGMATVLQKLETYSSERQQTRHPELGPATLSVGRISGGDAVNTVPSRCVIDVDCRLLPGESAAALCSDLATRLSDPLKSIRLEDPYMEAPSVYTPKSATVCQALSQAIESAGQAVHFETAHYATDAAQLASSGIPAIVFGPGSIQLAHTKAEYVPIHQVETACDIVIKLLTE